MSVRLWAFAALVILILAAARRADGFSLLKIPQKNHPASTLSSAASLLSPSGGFRLCAGSVKCGGIKLRKFVPTGGAVKMQAQGGKGGKRVVIVGAGIGGLCVAGRLAKAHPEWTITIVEKNEKAGGRLDTVQVAGGAYRFDTGPTLLLAPDIYKQTFEALGARLEDYVTLARVDPSYRVFSPDATNFTASTCLLDMKNQLEDIEEGSFQGFLRYMQEAGTNYVRGFNSRPFLSKDNSLLDYANLDNLLLLRDFNPINLVQKHSERLKTFFKTQKVRDIMSFQNLYIGLAPHTAPALFSLLQKIEEFLTLHQYLEIVEGIHYPLGGFGKVREGLLSVLSDLKVSIRYGSPVTKIIHSESAEGLMGNGKAATGLELEGGEVVTADIVVCNQDLPMAYSTLISGDSAKRDAERLRNLDYSSGTISFYWPLGRSVPELAHHSVFLSPDSEAAWDVALRGDGALPDNPSFYIACPGKTDATACPPNGESLMVLVPVGCMEVDGRGEGYERVRKEAKDKVLRRLRTVGIDIEDDILAEEAFCYTPAEWRDRYSLFKGAAFGLAHSMPQLVMFRPANRHASIKNLFFVGASTTPGNGVPLVMAGAKMCADRVTAECG